MTGPTDDQPDAKGVPYRKEIEALIAEALGPVTTSIGEVRSTVGKLQKGIQAPLREIGEDVRAMLTATGELTGRLHVETPGDLAAVAVAATSVTREAPKLLASVATTVATLAAGPLSWDRAKGAEFKRSLLAFAERLAALEARVPAAGGIAAPLPRGAPLLALIDDALLAPLAVLAGPLDFDAIAERLEKSADLLTAEGRRASTDDHRRKREELLVVRQLCSEVIAVLERGIAACPMQISIGGEAGVAAGGASAGSVGTATTSATALAFGDFIVMLTRHRGLVEAALIRHECERVDVALDEVAELRDHLMAK